MHTVSEGSFRGLTIGSTKDSTLQDIRKLGTLKVTPIPFDQFVVSYANVEDLGKITQVPGIRVSDYHHFFTDIFFADEKVSLIRSSANPESDVWFQNGQTRYEVKKRLTQLLVEKRDLRVTPIISRDGAGAVDIHILNHEVLSELATYDAWHFEINNEKPAGAMVDVYFSNDRLIRIEYRRASVLSH